MVARFLCAFGLSLSFTPLFAQVEMKAIGGLDLEYGWTANIPKKVVGNQNMLITVKVKNTAAAAQQVMVCVRGDSRFVVAGKELSLGQAEVTVKAAGTQLQCEKKVKNDDLDSAIGNMGCRVIQTLAAGATTSLDFVSGSLPRDPNGRTPVQDGIARPSNNQELGKPPGRAGAGHRTQAQTGRYQDDAGMALKGVRSLRDILQTVTLHFLTMPVAGWEMGCLSKADALNADDVAFIGGDAAKDYTPPCATTRPRTMACNQCYGMQVRFLVPKLPAAVKHSREVRRFADLKVAALERKDVPIQVELTDERPIAPPCMVSLAASYIPGVGSPFDSGDPSLPGKFALSPSTLDLSSANASATLSFTGPSFVPPDFSGDFFIAVTHLDSCGGKADPGQTLESQWIRLRPQIVCDVNQDQKVDESDIAEIMAVLGATADPGSPFDFNGDGTVTVSDARSCVLRCTKPNCEQ